MTTIILVGGADTGRAPIAATMLRAIIHDQKLNWQIESAGVLGHDGDTWQPEARMAVEHLGFKAPEHTARSLTPELAATADLLITVDRGIGRAMESRYGDVAWRTLPDLAGSSHEVMDPFRMTLDAWLIYGRELQQQLTKALPIIKQIVAGEKPTIPVHAPAAQTPMTLGDHPAVERLSILVNGIAGIPELIDWDKARNAIRETLQTIASNATGNASDLRPAATAMLVGVLGHGATPLTSNQLTILGEAVDVLSAPIDAIQLGTLAAAVGKWNG